MKNVMLYAAALALATGISAAHAANDFYVGGNLGQSTFKDAGPGWDDSDVAYKAYVGFTTGDVVDFRVGYTNLGKASLTSAFESDEFKSQGAFVDALFKYKPISELSVYGKIGAAYLQTKYNGSYSDGFYSGSASEKSNKIHFVPGVGVNYDVNGSLGVTAEYEYYLNVGDKSALDNIDYETDVSVLSVGVYFRL